MLASTSVRTGPAVTYESWSCPRCAFSLTIVHSRKGTHIEYDIEAWARECGCAGRDSPLACPCVGRNAWRWLSAPEPERAAVVQAGSAS